MPPFLHETASRSGRFLRGTADPDPKPSCALALRLHLTLFQQSQPTGEKSAQNAVFQQARTQFAKPDHADHPCVPRVWRAKRATLEAHTAFLRGLVLRIVCVPAEKLHFGLTCRLWADFAEIV